jgi:hypothetical protein
MSDRPTEAGSAVQPSRSAAPAKVVLVHGTFARGAPWTRPSSSGLCHQIRKRLGDETSFDAFEWSGDNRHAARLDAAIALAAHLEDLIAAYPP